jgi:hypothetical protein
MPDSTQPHQLPKHTRHGRMETQPGYQTPPEEVVDDRREQVELHPGLDVDRLLSTLPAQPRRCLYILETEYDPDGGYVPVLITEDVPGYAPLRGNGELAQPWYWGHDIVVAKRIATEANHTLGLSDRDVLDIVASSMAASDDRAAGR